MIVGQRSGGWKEGYGRLSTFESWVIVVVVGYVVAVDGGARLQFSLLRSTVGLPPIFV